LTLGASLYAANYMPLAPGNKWTYQNSATGGSFTVEVGNTEVLLNDHVYNTLTGFTPAKLLVRINEFGNLVYWDSDLNQDLLLTSFEIAGGARFFARQRICPEEDGQVQDKPGVHDGPAGPWSALEITYITFNCADVGDVLEQYVDNIGMVRRVEQSFAGPRTYDLVYARVGSQVITAGNSGSFSVTVTPGHDSGTWDATLRVDLRGGSPLTLTFPSGQEYDLRLRDSDGTTLWTWSADKVFPQVVHQRDVSRYSATVTVPFPPSIPEGVHVYTLEAWLTSEKDGPQFAAAATIETPRLMNKGVRRARQTGSAVN
jgi:hypothetical protein